MKKIFGVLAIILLSVAGYAQTYQLNARVTINAGQCVATVAGFAVPCNNHTNNGFSPVPVGVALTSVHAVTSGHTVLTIQYAGIVVVPDTSFGLLIPGDLLGDIDGTGNLNDFGAPQGGPVYVGLGPTYAGIVLGETGGNITMIVWPGYIPVPCVGCPAADAAPMPPHALLNK